MNKEKIFLQDVKDHSMEVLRDDGVSRHLRFSDNGSSIHQFSILTEPNILMIYGDTGCYTFQRLNDMFCFFRMDKNDFSRRKDRTLQINPSYWNEKVIDGRDRCMEFDFEGTKENIKESLIDIYEGDNEYGELEDLDKESIERILDEIFYYENDDTVQQVAERISEHGELGYDYLDLITYSPTSEYMWIIRAIVWGINQYDEYKANN